MILITDEMLAQAAHEVDMAILDMLPEPSECDHKFSPSFERKMNKLIRKAKRVVAYKVLKRVACVLIIIALSASTFVACNPNVRTAVIDWVKEKVDGFYHYFFVGTNGPETTVTDSSADSTTVTTERKDYCLTWVPEGYTLLNYVKADEGVTFVYINSSGKLMQFVYMYGISNQSFVVGGGDYEQKYITLGSSTGEILLAKDSAHSNVIIWKTNDGSVMFTISAYLGEEELIKMAENVIIEKNN